MVGERLDLSMDIMEETRFKRKHMKLFQRLTKELPFSYSEIESIMIIYYKLKKLGSDRRGVTKTQLREVLHRGFDMTNETFSNYVVMTLLKGPSPIVPMEAWARILALFLRGTLEQKIHHCFEVYDQMLTGKLTRDIMYRLLSNSLIGLSEDETDDLIRDLIEIITKKLDKDRDGKISFQDYSESCRENPLLIECFGPCLPSRLAVYTFLTTFTFKTGKV